MRAQAKTVGQRPKSVARKHVGDLRQASDVADAPSELQALRRDLQSLASFMSRGQRGCHDTSFGVDLEPLRLWVAGHHDTTAGGEL